EVGRVTSYNQGQTDHSSTRALPEGPGSVGGPMRCPWYLSYAFLDWARKQGPHDPLLPGDPMSCQSAPVEETISQYPHPPCDVSSDTNNQSLHPPCVL
ncbi:unnamed protein product, partial [Staurois parvus]